MNTDSKQLKDEESINEKPIPCVDSNNALSIMISQVLGKSEEEKKDNGKRCRKNKISKSAKNNPDINNSSHKNKGIKNDLRPQYETTLKQYETMLKTSALDGK